MKLLQKHHLIRLLNQVTVDIVEKQLGQISKSVMLANAESTKWVKSKVILVRKKRKEDYLLYFFFDIRNTITAIEGITANINGIEYSLTIILSMVISYIILDSMSFQSVAFITN